ncbi:hypothetical protein BH09ACT8_BH09ACT8_24710 [soil metagenome]
MVRIESRRVASSVALGALGILTAVTLTTMPTASADPVPLTPDPSQPVAAQPAPAPPAAPVAPGPVQTMAADPAAVPVAAPAAVPATAPAPEGVPHLPSPDNLPPGTTEVPTDPQQGHGMSYLRDLWHAVQTQNVSGSDALLLLTQRPMDANATPPMGMSSGPQPAAPVDPGAPAPPPDPAAPAPVAPPAPSAELLPVPAQ